MFYHNTIRANFQVNRLHKQQKFFFVVVVVISLDILQPDLLWFCIFMRKAGFAIVKVSNKIVIHIIKI